MNGRGEGKGDETVVAAPLFVHVAVTESSMRRHTMHGIPLLNRCDSEVLHVNVRGGASPLRVYILYLCNKYCAISHVVATWFRQNTMNTRFPPSL